MAAGHGRLLCLVIAYTRYAKICAAIMSSAAKPGSSENVHGHAFQSRGGEVEINFAIFSCSYDAAVDHQILGDETWLCIRHTPVQSRAEPRETRTTSFWGGRYPGRRGDEDSSTGCPRCPLRWATSFLCSQQLPMSKATEAKRGGSGGWHLANQPQMHTSRQRGVDEAPQSLNARPL